MSVVSVNEIRDERSGTKARDGREATRVYVVKTNSTSDSSVTVLNAGSLPVLGDSHPEDSWMKATRFSASPHGDSGLHWRVTVTYETRPQSDDADDPVDNPLQEPPEIEFSFADTTEIMDRDSDGRWIENSLGEPFQDVERETNDVTIVITRNEPNCSIATAARFKDALNDDDFWGQPAGFWKIRSIVARSMRTGDTFYVRVVYTIDGRVAGGSGYLQNSSASRSYTLQTTSPGWYRRFVNQGNLVIRDSKLLPPVDENGKEIDGPVRISISGAQLDKDDPPVYLLFNPYTFRDFSVLQLPDLNISPIAGTT